MNAAAVKTLQTILASLGLYRGAVDGISGPLTNAAVSAALSDHPQAPPGWRGWPAPRWATALVQLISRAEGLDPGPVDGIWGPRTAAAAAELAARAALPEPPRPGGAAAPVPARGSGAMAAVADRARTANRLDGTPGAGAASTTGGDVALARSGGAPGSAAGPLARPDPAGVGAGDAGAAVPRDADPMPARPHLPPGPRWPRQDFAAMTAFYGPNGLPGGRTPPLVRVPCPWPLRLAWEPATTVSAIAIHERCADSLARVLARVDARYGADRIARLGLDIFGGSYNPRRMRGGSRWSVHAWGAAIDWDPVRNRLTWGRARAALAHPDLDAWWEIWEAEGWLSLGRARDVDWMHVQAAGL
ncbi:MAG: hypothetical protein RQ752_01215 [Thermohalobaculum sp.]|nr:hypothetical protein [Thermohalobaculum sp.]